jgi:hypothetical protein
MLKDWLFHGERIIFSCFDSSSGVEIAVTDMRLIFYKDGLLSESLEAYNLGQIAGYRIKAAKKAIYIIAGILMMIFSLFMIVMVAEGVIKASREAGLILVIISGMIMMIGLMIAILGAMVYHALEIIAGGTIVKKSLRISKGELEELAKNLSHTLTPMIS